jgi:hypothetical protein
MTGWVKKKSEGRGVSSERVETTHPSLLTPHFSKQRIEGSGVRSERDETPHSSLLTPHFPRKTLTNSRSRQRSGVITIACGGGGLVWGKRPLLGVGTRRPMVAPILTEVHFSDRAQWVVALHEQRLGSD